MKALTRREHAQLLISCRRVLRLRQCPYAMAVLLSPYLGTRESELLDIGKSNLLVSDAAIECRTLKQRDGELKLRVVPLPRWLFKKLMRYAATVTGEKLFNFHDSTLRRQWYMIRPSKKCFHSLRHTFTKYYYEKSGHNLSLVSRLLGHSDVNMTMEYLEDLNSPDDLRTLMGMED